MRALLSTAYFYKKGDKYILFEDFMTKIAPLRRHCDVLIKKIFFFLDNITRWIYNKYSGNNKRERN